MRKEADAVVVADVAAEGVGEDMVVVVDMADGDTTDDRMLFYSISFLLPTHLNLNPLSLT